MLTTLAFSLLTNLPVAPPTEWLFSFPEAQQRAAASDRLILVYCWGDGSEFCAKLYQDTLCQPQVDGALGELVCMSAKHGGDGVAAVFERYAVRTLPTMLFLRADGTAEDVVQGFIPPDDLVGEIARIRRGEGTISGMRKALAAAEKGSADEIDLRWSLAGKLVEVGGEVEHDAIRDSIRRDDPRGDTQIGAALLVNEVVRGIVGEDGDGDGDGAAGEAAQQWDLAPLHALANGSKSREARFAALGTIANLEARRQRLAECAEALARAHQVVPDDRALEWTREVAWRILEHSEQLTSKEKKLALEFADDHLKRLRASQGKASKTAGDEEAVERKVQLARALRLLAHCYRAVGQRDKAIATLRKGVELVDDDGLRAELREFEGS